MSHKIGSSWYRGPAVSCPLSTGGSDYPWSRRRFASNASRSTPARRRVRRERARPGGARARDGGGGLPRRIAPRVRHAHPPARRLRRRRGGAARRVPGGARAVAARRRAGEPARVARVDRPVQGDRRHAPARAVRRARRRRRRRSSRRRRPDGVGATRRASRTTGCGSIFTCCHPALAPDAQVALTLREVCGLTTEEIAQRVPDRPRRRSRSASCARRPRSATRASRTRCRRPTELPERLDAVLRVIYLVFNEGYSASSGASLTRARPFGRGDPARAAARRAAAGARGDRTARADAAARIAARGARRRPPATLVLLDDAGPVAVGPGPDRGGVGARGARARPRAGSARTRCRRRSRRCMRRRASAADTNWAEIVGLYDRAARGRALAGDRAESRGRRGDARRPGRRARARRRHPRARRAARTTASRTPRGRTCADGSDGRPRPGRPISARLRSRGRSPSGASSSAGCAELG